MQRKALGIVFLCLVLLVAIVLGYWDMLSSEKLRIAQTENLPASEEVAGRQDSASSSQPVPDRPSTSDAGQTESANARAIASDATPVPDEAARIVPDPADSVPLPEDSAKLDAPGATTAEKQPAEPGLISSGPAAAEGDRERSAAEPVPAARGNQSDIADQPAIAERSVDAAPPEGGVAMKSTENGSADDATASVETPASPLESASSAPPVEGQATAVDRPMFDLLRVEPDGSTLVAGRSAPGNRVILHAGEAVVGEDTANDAGEFVIVLPEPLTPGEHAISITAMTPEGMTTGSSETAVVSVPEPGRGDDVLAMVESPDEASRLMTVPASPSRADEADGPDVGTTAAGRSATGISQDEAPTPAPVAGPGEPVDTNAGILPKPNATEEKKTAPEPTILPRLRIEAVEVEGEKIFVAGAADAGASVRIYLDNVLVAEDRATADNRFLVAAERQVAVGDHFVRADQVAANGNVTARAEVPFTRPEGQAVAAIAPDPTIGREKLRPSADAAVADGPEAETRVAAASAPVGESVSAEARAAGPTGGAAEMQGSSSQPDTEAGDSRKGDNATTTEAPATDLSPDAESAAEPVKSKSEMAAASPTAEAGAAAPSNSTEASEAPASGPPPDGALPTLRNRSAELARQRANPTPSTDGTSVNPPVQIVEPRSQTGTGTSEIGQDGTGAEASAVADATDTESSSQSMASRTQTKLSEPQIPLQPGSGTVGERQASATLPTKPSAGASESEANATGALDIPINRQAPLATAAGRVIIRKGDTLWGISRDTYGRGSRYTVIYFANGNRIRDPDLIYPGQVFRLPGIQYEARDECECDKTSEAAPKG